MLDGAKYVTAIADNLVVPPTLKVTELTPDAYVHVSEDKVPDSPLFTDKLKSELLVNSIFVILPILDEIVNSEPLYMRHVPGELV